MANDLAGALGRLPDYETLKIPFTRPARKTFYKPDFPLPNKIIVETKGEFPTKDRQKHLAIRDQYPHLDIRFVFSNPNTRISKQSRTTYAAWCEKNKFMYAKGSVPKAWLDEPAKTLTIADTTRGSS